MNIQVTIVVHDEDDGTIHASAQAKYIVGDLPVDEMVGQVAEEVLEGVVAHVMAPDYHNLVPRFGTADDDKTVVPASKYADAFIKQNPGGGPLPLEELQLSADLQRAAKWVQGFADKMAEPRLIVSDEFEVVTPADAEAAADAALKRARESIADPKPWSQRGMKSSGGESPGFPPAPINRDYNNFVMMAGGLRREALAQLVDAFRGNFQRASSFEAQASDIFVEASNFVLRNLDEDDYDEVDPDHALQATFDAGFLAAVKELLFRKDDVDSVEDSIRKHIS